MDEQGSSVCSGSFNILDILDGVVSGYFDLDFRIGLESPANMYSRGTVTEKREIEEHPLCKCMDRIFWSKQSSYVVSFSPN